MHVRCLSAALAAIGLFVGCYEPTQSPPSAHPSYAIGAPAACPGNPTVIVSDEGGLAAALAAAQPGDVIAVDGFFDVGDAIIRTDDVTLTCATPGSGLRGRGDLGLIVKVVARRVTVADLVLDATNSVEGAYVAFYDGVTNFGEDSRFLRNRVLCGATRKCVFFGSESQGGSRGGLVTDNHLTVTGGETGITIQGVSGGRAERNTIAAASPSGEGIRANGNEGIVVAENVVSGPWSASAHFLDGLFSSVVSDNRLEGARVDGVIFEAAADVQFVRNTVGCGTDECLFAAGAERLVVAYNQFSSSGSGSGVQLQGGIDGSRVAHNMIVTTAPSISGNLGGIRARDGSSVVITDNTVIGPWANSMALADLADSRIERNRLEGATGFGAGLGLGVSFREVSMTGNVLQTNQITGAGVGGIFARSACNNTFLGNALEGNPDGLVLRPSTGANRYVGNRNLVVDDGDLDCNGDGVSDPNIITGPGFARHGGSVGALVANNQGSGKLQ